MMTDDNVEVVIFINDTMLIYTCESPASNQQRNVNTTRIHMKKNRDKTEENKSACVGGNLR